MNQIIPAHCFCIRILNGKKGDVIRAQDVSGLSMRLNLDKLEGIVGNTGNQHIPAGISYEPLVIKRAYMQSDPGVHLSKIQESVQKLQVNPVDMGIHLRDERGKYIQSWNVMKAYLTSWQISGFNATEQGVFMEQLSFDYSKLRLV